MLLAQTYSVGYDVGVTAGETTKSRKGRKTVVVMGAVLLMLLMLTVSFTWDHIRFWWLFESLGNNEQGHPEYRHRQTGIVMVRVPGGSFLMGTSKEEGEQAIEELVKEWVRGGWNPAQMRKVQAEQISREQPRHEVTLSPFLIAKYEVSQAQWQASMEENPSKFEGQGMPVDSLSWDDCQDFCEKTGLSFPSEAQWEYACRAGTNTAFFFGETISQNEVAFGHKLPGPYTQSGKLIPVTISHAVSADSLKPNGYGLHNMHGNLYEWCADQFDKDFYGRPEASGLDPLCTTASQRRVLRGGSWSAMAGYCRSAFRRQDDPSNRLFTYGFRPAYYPVP